jgi:osmotically-inducible protein OsmY
MPVRVKSDEALQLDILAELKWDPRVDQEEVGVSVDDGIVTLSGRIGSFAKRIAAEECAHHVHGVKAVVNDLEVHLPTDAVRDDVELAHAVVEALRWNAHVPNEALDVTVHDGWVTLKGTLDYRYQEDETERIIRNMMGVRGLTSLIRTKPPLKPRDIRRQIEDALVRSAQVDARHISVEVDGPKVILKGSVRTTAELHDARRAAWSAPGVEEVENRIAVMPDLGFAATNWGGATS